MAGSRGVAMGPRILLALFGVAVVAAVIAGIVAPRSAGAQTPASVQLYSGWNIVLYDGLALPPELALNDAYPMVDSVWEFKAVSQTWTVWGRDLPPRLLSLTTLEPGGIYFLKSEGEVMWSHPLTPPPPPGTAPADTGPADPGTSGDTPGDPGAEPAPTPVTGMWRVAFTRDTVLFEFEDRLEVGEDGSATATKGGGETQAFTLDAGTLGQIDAILEGEGYFAAWPTDTRSGCASCFRYAVTITTPDGATVELLTDGAGVSGALLELVDALTAAVIAAPG